MTQEGFFIFYEVPFHGRQYIVKEKGLKQVTFTWRPFPYHLGGRHPFVQIKGRVNFEWAMPFSLFSLLTFYFRNSPFRFEGYKSAIPFLPEPGTLGVPSSFKPTLA